MKQATRNLVRLNLKRLIVNAFTFTHGAKVFSLYPYKVDEVQFLVKVVQHFDQFLLQKNCELCQNQAHYQKQ